MAQKETVWHGMQKKPLKYPLIRGPKYSIFPNKRSPMTDDHLKVAMVPGWGPPGS
jgi:hypothetical protein